MLIFSNSVYYKKVTFDSIVNRSKNTVSLSKRLPALLKHFTKSLESK